MGQYYKPIIIDEKRKPLIAFYSWDYNNGLKLMEHSYLDNNFVNAVVNTMVSKFPKGARLVWAGDYAEPEKRKKENLFEVVGDKLYHQVKNTRRNSKIRYIVNLTKKQFVDLLEVPNINGMEVHPLPLLTAEGNGLGGGDFLGNGQKYVGSWAGDLIVFHRWKNWGDNIKNGEYCKKYKTALTEIKPNFTQKWCVEDGLIQILKIIRDMKNDGEFTEDDKKNLLKRINAEFPQLNNLYQTTEI